MKARYLDFHQTSGLPFPLPPTESSVLRYLAHLQLNGFAPKTLRVQLAGLSFFSKVNGWWDPSSSFRIRRAIEGWMRLAPRRNDTRRPVSLAMMRQFWMILDDTCSTPFEAKLFRAAFTLAFYGAFRSSELLPASRDDWHGNALSGHDVQIDGTRLTINLRRSKTDQAGQGTMVTLVPAPAGDPCPVQSLREYLSVRPHLTGPLLLHADGHCLSRYQFTAVLRACIRQAHLPPEQFGIHSFRIGAATHAFEEGLPTSDIMAVGRWRSAAFKAYIRPGPAF